MYLKKQQQNLTFFPDLNVILNTRFFFYCGLRHVKPAEFATNLMLRKTQRRVFKRLCL